MNAKHKTTSNPRKMCLDELGCNQNTLTISGVDAHVLAKKYGTPLYVYDANAIKNRYWRVRQAISEKVQILYALKANPSLSVSRVLRDQGAGAEVASAGEICIADRAGFNGDQIHFSGPGKSLKDFELAFRKKIYSINIESFSEYETVRDLARHYQHSPCVSIRVNPNCDRYGAGIRMAGGSSKFGVDTDQVSDLLDAILSDGICKFRGLHLYSGTQCTQVEHWLANAKFLIDFANELERFAFVKNLNLGGGFAVPVYEGDKSFNIEIAAQGLLELIELDWKKERNYFCELGRFLVATSGVYLTKVLYTKWSQEKKHIVIDGGMHHHAAAAGIGNVIKRAFPIVNCTNIESADNEEVSVGGPLCTPADELGSNVSLPETQPGDLLAVLVSGAYGLTFSNVKFLSHPTAAEVLVNNGRDYLIRERGNYQDALLGQVLIEQQL